MKKLWEYQAEQARAAVPVIVKQGAVTERAVTEFRDRVLRIKEDTVTVTKEIERHVPPSADPVLAAGWVRVHDAAAGAISEAAARADDAAPAIASSTALRGVVGNYGTCNENAAQLIALQQWVRWQYKAMNLEELGY